MRERLEIENHSEVVVELIKNYCKIDEVEAINDNGKMQLVINFLYMGKEWKLGLNKTNQLVIRNAKIMPKEIVGCKLTFEKTKARNPTTNSLVDSFGLSKIEKTK
jgi:hypothetical protein